MILQVLLAIGVAYATWSFICMEANYRRASAMGIPLVRLPIDPMNIPWQILEPHLWRLLDLLPFKWGTFGLYSRRGWHFHEKAKSHLRYGPVWALVTPRDIHIHVGDPDAVHDIFTRRTDFIRPVKMYKLLEIYGPCISTADTGDWPRHRKVLAAPFNETIMAFVWNESIKQGNEMLQSWTSRTNDGIPSVSKDTRTLSLNVLAATGFKKSYNFRSSTQSGADEAHTYRDALQSVLDNAIFLMLVPPRVLLLPLLPASWVRVGKSAAAFKQHMKTMLEEETSSFQRGEAGTGGLMTSFVRALDTYKKDEIAPKTSEHSLAKGLTVDEIFGNIFVINFAGHDTTANTLAFTMLLLAANPEIQEWVAEELRLSITSLDNKTWDYNDLFPKLKRCQAILFETLRLYPPILALPKWTNSHPQTLRIGSSTLTIPPHTGISPSLLAIQTHPQYWPDPLSWRPSRWIVPSPSPKLNQEESLFTPAQSTFFPWSDGPQNCPGVKFAQVEYVAVLACLLREHRLGIVRREGEGWEGARERVLAATMDCNMELLLRMQDADRVRLTCRRV